MYKVKASKFLNWYFADGDDHKYIGRRVERLLENSGVAKITVEDLFDEQNEIPTWILESYDGDDDYIESEYVELIKD